MVRRIRELDLELGLVRAELKLLQRSHGALRAAVFRTDTIPLADRKEALEAYQGGCETPCDCQEEE